MSEKQIEQYLCRLVKEDLRGRAYKFTSPGRHAVPDRICVIPGHVFFVECKAPGKDLTPAQRRECERLKKLDQWVYMVDSKFLVNLLIAFWRERLQKEGYDI